MWDWHNGRSFCNSNRKQMCCTVRRRKKLRFGPGRIFEKRPEEKVVVSQSYYWRGTLQRHKWDPHFVLRRLKTERLSPQRSRDQGRSGPGGRGVNSRPRGRGPHGERVVGRISSRGRWGPSPSNKSRRFVARNFVSLIRSHTDLKQTLL